jgi:hypothetical protein
MYNVKKKRLLAEKQIELQHCIQSVANVNIVTCGHCETILLHDTSDEKIECFGCDETLDLCDCPTFGMRVVKMMRSLTIKNNRICRIG